MLIYYRAHVIVGGIFMTNDTLQIPHPDIEIVTDKPESKNPILIEGFPGIGLIGNIASQQIIDELEMKYIGTMSSQYFPPIAVLFEGIVNMPVRIYESKEHELIVVVSDVPIPPAISLLVSRALMDWAESINVKKVVSVAGIATAGGEHKVFGGATDSASLNEIKDVVEIFQMGTISGISGSVMAECFMRKIPAISLLGGTRSSNPDPLAAVEVIKVLNTLYNLSIDTDRLLAQAGQIAIEMQKLAEETREVEEPTDLKKPSPMYG